jgi:hypothetical protein
MVEADVGSRKGDGFVQRYHFAQDRLGGEPVSQGSPAMFCEMTVDLKENYRRDQDRHFAFKVMAKSGRLGVFGQVFKPAGGVNDVEFRSAPCGNDIRLSI